MVCNTALRLLMQVRRSLIYVEFQFFWSCGSPVTPWGSNIAHVTPLVKFSMNVKLLCKLYWFFLIRTPFLAHKVLLLFWVGGGGGEGVGRSPTKLVGPGEGYFFVYRAGALCTIKLWNSQFTEMGSASQKTSPPPPPPHMM